MESRVFEVDVRAPTSMLFQPFLARTGMGKQYASAPVVQRSTMSVAHAIGPSADQRIRTERRSFLVFKRDLGKIFKCAVGGTPWQQCTFAFYIDIGYARSRSVSSPAKSIGEAALQVLHRDEVDVGDPGVLRGVHGADNVFVGCFLVTEDRERYPLVRGM